MNMRFSNRFAGYLTKGEIRKLFFDVLEKKYGSVRKASEVAGIERKTIYNLDMVKDVSFDTKVKILKAAYEADPLFTLSFLVKVLRSRASEALFMLIDYIKSEALGCKDQEKFMKYLVYFENILDEVGGPLRDEIKIEIEDVKQILATRALNLGIKVRKILPVYYGLVWNYSSPNIEKNGPESLQTVAGTLVTNTIPTFSRRRERKGVWRSEEEELKIIAV